MPSLLNVDQGHQRKTQLQKAIERNRRKVEGRKYRTQSGGKIALKEQSDSEQNPWGQRSEGGRIKTWLRSGLLWLGWGLNLTLFLRLIFASGGVLDYQEMQKKIEKKESENLELQAETKVLQKEIKLLQEDSNYQKHQAVKHLGVLAPGEYLLIFEDQELDEVSAIEEK